MPTRADIDPTDIPWALSRLYLVDYDPASGRFRYRVAGSEVEAMYTDFTGRHSVRGMHLDELLVPSEAAMVINRWKPLPVRGAIIHMQGLIYSLSNRAAVGERLLLPLAETDNGTVTGLIGLTVRTGAIGAIDKADRRIRITYIEARHLHTTAEGPQPKA
jgi:hypothetical protein